MCVAKPFEEYTKGHQLLLYATVIYFYLYIFSCFIIFIVRHYASTVYAIVVCLCVCVSVTLQYYIKMAKHRITQIMPHDSAGTLVF